MMISAVPLGVHADETVTVKERHYRASFDGFKGATDNGQYKDTGNAYDWCIWAVAKNSQFSDYEGQYWGAVDVAKGVYGRGENDGSAKFEVTVNPNTVPINGNPLKSDNPESGICNFFWTNHDDNFGTYTGTKYFHVGFDLAFEKIQNVDEDANFECRIYVSDTDGNQHTMNMLAFYRPTVLKLAGQFTKYYMEPQKWTRFDYVFNKETNTVDAYINGTIINRNVPLGFSINGDKGGLNSVRFFVLDPKNEVDTSDTSARRRNTVYLDEFSYNFTEKPYNFNYYMRDWDSASDKLYSDVSYKQIAKMIGTDLELSNPSYPNLADTEKGLLYASEGMTVEQLLTDLNVPAGAECTIIQEREANPDWRGYNELTGSTPIASGKHNENDSEIRETFVKVSVPNSESVIGRVYYYPIADAKLTKCTNSEGIDATTYEPGDTLKFEILSSADNSTYTVMAAQYSTDGELIKCQSVPVVKSAVQTPVNVSFTTENKGSESGKVKVYLWNGKMTPFRTVAEYSPDPPIPDEIISTDAVDNLTIDNSAKIIEGYGQDIEGLTANLKAAAPEFQYK